MNTTMPLTETGDTSKLGTPVEKLPPSATLAEIRAVFDRDGVVCLKGLIDADTVARMNALLDPIMEDTPLGLPDADAQAQSVLGMRTKRRCDVLAADPELMEPFVAHPRVMELVESVLGPYCTSILIHQAQAAEIHPGESSQIFHRDSGSLWRNPGVRFHQGLVVNIALRDFTVESGATSHLMGSNRWPEALYFEPKEGDWNPYLHPPRRPVPEEVTVTPLSSGDALIWSGDIFHGGGANTTEDRARRSFITAYSLGWLRGEINQQLMWPPEVARKFPRRIQRLIGYQVENSVIGCLEMGQDPIQLLQD